MSFHSQDFLFRQIQQLQITLESCQEQLAMITETLNNVRFTTREDSQLTRQFNMMQSPSDSSPNPRFRQRMDRKKTPEFRKPRDGKRRVALTQIPTNEASRNLDLYRQNALISKATSS